MMRPPPTSTLTYALFPVTTLFRSHGITGILVGRLEDIAVPGEDVRDCHCIGPVSDARRIDREVAIIPGAAEHQFMLAAEQTELARGVDEIGRESCRERVCKYV